MKTKTELEKLAEKLEKEIIKIMGKKEYEKKYKELMTF